MSRTEPIPDDQLPAGLAAQVAYTCLDAGQPARHRAFIWRDGSVTTPDHDPDDGDTVIVALGGTPGHPCDYWTRVGGPGGIPVVGADITTWEIVPGPTVWTEKATWTVLSAILGARWYGQVHPEHALGVAQVLAGRGFALNPTVLTLLYQPSMRKGGFRRGRAVLASEVRAFLDAGVPGGLVADLAALDLTPEHAAAGMREVRRLGLPADALLRAAELLPADGCLALLRGASPMSAAVFAQTLIAAADPAEGMTFADAAGALAVREVAGTPDRQSVR